MRKHSLYIVPLLLLASCGGNGHQFVSDEKYGDLEYCFIEHHPDSIVAKPGDVLFLDMDYYSESGKMLFNSNEVSQSYRMYAPQQYLTDNIEQGLYLMHKGDSAIFHVKAGPFFENVRKVKIPKSVDPSETLTFHVRMRDIYDGAEYQKQIDEYNAKMEAQELLILKDYLRNENISQQPSQSGLYKIVSKAGDGKQTAEGKTVTVHFVGSLIDGSEFDNSYKRNEPFTFQLGAGKSIPGFEEGIASMTKGEKCRLIMPSTLGYGSRGVSGRIPPFATLIFDIELVDIK
ncbi:MAG: FKBP-type peptidyl-prolyl cis-trans isomerase [Bacteroidales bacterium]|nr:FKBP-type peptidyl-prolyl cis-trans isomerase [Bacteroidales bacterium]